MRVEYRPVTQDDIAPRLTGLADLKIEESEGEPSPVRIGTDDEPNVCISLGTDGLHHPILDLDGKWDADACTRWAETNALGGRVNDDALLIVAPSTNWALGHLYIVGSPMTQADMIDTLNTMVRMGLGSRDWLHFVERLGYGALRLPGVLKPAVTA